MKRLAVAVLCVAIVIAFAGNASAAVAIIIPDSTLDDGTAENDLMNGNNDFTNIATSDMLVRLQTIFDFEQRPLMEFPLSAIPAGSTINSVGLLLYGQSATALLCQLYGYAGDGVLTLGDEQASDLLASFSPMTGPNPPITVPPSFIQGLINNGDPYAGFVIRAIMPDPVNFWFSETSDGFSPTLVVDYTPVPEPGSIALIGLGAVGLAVYRRKRG
ncbi:MAG TPA: PEP-CTERM sorting domain-containing protein [Candidatus Brocadiia bacterium]|nr:PEP-CTERM sorting domain-containing protein [Candidatus Brocadiia bacterium]